MGLDHSRAPVLESLVAFRERGDYVFGPPGHRQGRGVDQRVMNISARASSPPTSSPSTVSTTGGSLRRCSGRHNS